MPYLTIPYNIGDHMKKLKVNYIDGTSKEVPIKNIHISNTPEDSGVLFCNIDSVKDGVVINATSNIVPDISLVKNIEFMGI